jgi:hypothetical protein
MAELVQRFWKLDEFLAFDDGTDTRYELFDGQIVAMAPASDVISLDLRELYAGVLAPGGAQGQGSAGGTRRDGQRPTAVPVSTGPCARAPPCRGAGPHLCW